MNDNDVLKELNTLFYENNKNVIENKSINNECYEDVCLISLEKLEEDCITLKCKHKFNYVPLYNYYFYKNKVIHSLDCPYCEKHMFGTLPIRTVNNKYLYNLKIKQPLEKCITDDHKCFFKPETLGCSNIGFNGRCIEHHDFILILREQLKYNSNTNNYNNNKKQEYLKNKIKLLKKKATYLLKTKEFISYNILYDDLILDNLNITQLKTICKYYNIDEYVCLKHLTKYELILFIKEFDKSEYVM